MKKIFAIISTMSLLTMLFMATPIAINAQTTATHHPFGTNVLAPDGTIYRIVEGPLRRPYSSVSAFLSYKFNRFADVVTASAADMAITEGNKLILPAREGSLLNDNGTIYLVTGGGSRAGFASEAVFKGYGYSYSNVYKGDTSFMNTYPAMTSSEMLHPDGTLINLNGTLYQMESGQRLAFPSIEVLESWGYWETDAVMANSFDAAAPISAVMSARTPNLLSY